MVGKKNLGKFDAKSDEGIFLGYSLHSKAYRIYNKRTMTIEESIHVSFDESNAISPTKDILDDVAESLEQMHIHGQDSKGKGKGSNEDPPEEAKSNDELPKEWKASKDHPLDNIIGDISKGVTTRHSLKDLCNNMAFVSMIEPKNIKEAIVDDN